MIDETGVSGLTMEGIAGRAGTAKTSLYRRWSKPEDILVEAALRHYPQETPARRRTTSGGACWWFLVSVAMNLIQGVV
uniref:TetR/AcrR family transcriptional regulator n=1 Tax=Nocardiopsis valliformis TaxID=239974 RepID=UPI001EF9CCCC